MQTELKKKDLEVCKLKDAVTLFTILVKSKR